MIREMLALGASARKAWRLKSSPAYHRYGRKASIFHLMTRRDIKAGGATGAEHNIFKKCSLK